MENSMIITETETVFVVVSKGAFGKSEVIINTFAERWEAELWVERANDRGSYIGARVRQGTQTVVVEL
jgi:hypothetical protein